MSLYINNKFRIKRNANQQELMQKLTNDYKIFGSYRDILVLSAIIGYNNNRFEPIEKPASDGVLMQFFTSSDYDLIDLIAYAHEKKQSILMSDDKYEIFASYANGGFPILVQSLGINKDEEVTDAVKEKMLIKMYSKLLSKQFKAQPVDMSDLLIK